MAEAISSAAASISEAPSGKKRVAYFYDEMIGLFHFGNHPMKPHRVRLTHDLVVSYGLADSMDVMKGPPLAASELTKFHADDYVKFLQYVTPTNTDDWMPQMEFFNLGNDCPVFDGLFEYCQSYSGASVAAARLLNSGSHDRAVNWSGGMHHAKDVSASGFCYVNDIVLAILELLRVHQRVLYLDLDIHHGDGVEEAFYTTNRVMTCSFHMGGGTFFPGTGLVGDNGVDEGKGYTLNFPLRQGMDDVMYTEEVFKPVVRAAVDRFRPDAVVVCAGADSLCGDRLGCWNLSIKGHAECVRFVRGLDLPTLLLGGGGYTLRNVARCWTAETAVMADVVLDDELPQSCTYYDAYAPEPRLQMRVSNMVNENTIEQVEETRRRLLKTLKKLEAAPSVQIGGGPWVRQSDTDTAMTYVHS